MGVYHGYTTQEVNVIMKMEDFCKKHNCKLVQIDFKKETFVLSGDYIDAVVCRDEMAGFFGWDKNNETKKVL